MPHTSRALSLIAAMAFMVLMVTSAPASAQANDVPDVPLLVSTQWLSSHADDRRLVIVAVHMDRAAYDSAHIRGAQFLPYSAYVRQQDGLTTELPPLVALDSVFASVGISNDSRIVIYGPPVISHRLFLALDVTGMRGRVGMLDGGIDEWRHDGGALASGPPAVVPHGRLALTPRSDVLVDRAWVRDHLGDAGYQFVDARGRGFPEGHLQGAVSISAFSLTISPPADRASWYLPNADSLQRAFGGVAPGKQLVAYCAIGETASVVYFVARQMGRPVRFYDGSLEDWRRAPAGELVRSP